MCKVCMSSHLSGGSARLFTLKVGESFNILDVALGLRPLKAKQVPSKLQPGMSATGLTENLTLVTQSAAP